MQKYHQQEPQDILANNLIPGLDGRKMSSSWGNTINITDVPDEMFGKIMSLGDDLIITYFINCTRVPIEEISQMEKAMKNGSNPRDFKLKLAEEIVKIYHGEKEAEKAKEYFVKTFSKRELPDEIGEIKVTDGMRITDLLVKAGVASSLSDARRKIEQGGVEIDREKISDWKMILDNNSNGKVVKVGKKDFVKIKF